MRKIIHYFYLLLVDFFRSFSLYGGFLRDFVFFWLQNRTDERFSLSFLDQYPCLFDKTQDTPFEPHYIYHPAWAARVVRTINPAKHIDISSTLTFCSILSAFVPVDFYDYRPANLKLTNLKSKHGDLMHLPFETDSVESISCMHTIEHIGLGRYGDPIDPQGDLKAMKELIRVTKKGGSILFVTPVGKKKLRFNAHRIYAYKDILKYFQSCRLKEFSLVPDNVMSVGMIKNPKESIINDQVWGCGCFWFIKK